MRTIKLILLALILIAIVLLALANREIVTVQLLPEPLDQVLAVSVDVPLFVVGLVSILVGMVLGYILEWLREYKYRRRAAQKAREAEQLSRELDRVKKSGKPEDDVLALIN
jgi:lipopolysaccharide assembly protein A